MSAALDLFADEDCKTVEQTHVDSDPVDSALRAIEAIFSAGKAAALGFSGGKDSGSCVNLALTAAMRIKARSGHSPTLHVMNTDTTVESPIVRSIVEIEFARMTAFAKRHGLDLHLHVARPSLNAAWAGRIIGGRALPSFPNSRGDCSVSWKTIPATRTLNSIKKESTAPVVLILGTRREESLQRAINTAARGETAHRIWYGPEGDERLSPILHWSTDDVWTYLGECAAGMHPSYSTFQETLKFYGAASGTSCAIVADVRAASTSKPCGARSGCHVCLRVQADKSAENMVEFAPDEYPYLVPLLRLRDWMAKTQWSWRHRNYVGRTIEDGWIKIRPDQYSPQTVKQLLRWTLWAQSEANRLGAPSFVQPVGIQELILIDFYWSARAYHPPGEALRVYFEHLSGKREAPPKLPIAVPASPLPEIGRIFVGRGWEEPAHPMRPEGLRCHSLELFHESCGSTLRTGRDGEVFMDVEEEPEFTVDEEGAALFLEFEAERRLKQFPADYDGDWTAGVMQYLQLGTVSLAKGQSSGLHNMLRRSQWLQRHNLHGQRSPEELRERCTELATYQPNLF